jgi:CRISPR system Cascade subunit CasD
MAVRVDRPGTLLCDYHTAQNVAIASSKPGAKARIKDCEPSSRYYLSDADFLIGLEGPMDVLEPVDEALSDPVWPLFLGRKAFPPSIPVRVPDGLLPDGTLPEALETQPWWKRSRRDERPESLRIVMETDSADGEARGDVPLDFRAGRRRFLARRVRDLQPWPLPENLAKEWPPCTSPS